MPKLTLPDVTLHYETLGTGPALLLIPGMLSDNASWTPLIEPLSQHFRLILPDPRGAGQTRPTDAPISLRHLAEDCLSLLNHLELDRSYVVGHSLGGLVALALAKQAPERIGALITLGSSPAKSSRVPAIFQNLSDIRASADDDHLWVRTLFSWLFHDSFFALPEAVEASVQASLAYPHLQSPSAMQHQVNALSQLDITSLPTHVDLPALGLLAQDDALILPKTAAPALKALGLQTQIIQSAGHSLHWDQPQAVADSISDFLAAHPFTKIQP